MVNIMKIFLLALLMSTSLIGCASADKLTMAKGKWQPINQAGFIPSTVKRYVEGVDIFVDEDTVSSVEVDSSNDTENKKGYDHDAI